MAVILLYEGEIVSKVRLRFMMFLALAFLWYSKEHSALKTGSVSALG
jgi:hypothetical protein